MSRVKTADSAIVVVAQQIAIDRVAEKDAARLQDPFDFRQHLGHVGDRTPILSVLQSSSGKPVRCPQRADNQTLVSNADLWT